VPKPRGDVGRPPVTSRGELEQVALELFAERGFEATTVDDIAEAAGISRPTVYKYTRSKQHLLDLMVDEVTGYMTRQLKLVMESGEPAETRLRRMIRTHIDSATGNRTFYAIVFSEEVELSDAGREAFRSWAHERTQDFRVLLEECLPPGSPLDPTVAANLVLSMLATIFRWYDPAGPVGPEELSRQIEHLLGALFTT
jgi:TetR/AcrR family transcriptional regulator, cholesterol catabolism regulator